MNFLATMILSTTWMPLRDALEIFGNAVGLYNDSLAEVLLLLQMLY